MADFTGPISTMPGQAHRLPAGATCDLHESRPAVARIQGETDSMGAELNDMCQECLDNHRQHVRTADTSGTCDWCKQPAGKRLRRRDYDEGMAGPIYLVCHPCIDRENAAINAELERYGDDW